MVQKISERERSFTESVILLKSAESQNKEYERWIDELVATNDKLCVWAAVSYTELTPWYEKFTQFFKENDLEFYQKKKSKKSKVKDDFSKTAAEMEEI